ncbi:MAG: nucleotidyltransferase domain-containing protein [Desulfomonilaceae bacterium]
MATNKCDQSPPSSDPPKRKKLLEQELTRYLRLLTEHGNPEKVILFGTLATGRINEWSDIDLVVVEQTELSFFERLRRIRKLLQPRVGIDVMVYTPEEFNQLSAERPFFRDEIVAKGKVVYERGR